MKKAKSIAIIAVIAAMYFLLTMVSFSFAYGAIQFRISEALTILPLFFPQAIWGLTIGCFLANIPSPLGFIDVVSGSLATLLASFLTYMIGKRLRKKREIVNPVLGGIPPILVNALGLPLIWLVFANDALYFFNVAMVMIGQIVMVYGLGIPLYFGLKKPVAYIKSKM